MMIFYRIKLISAPSFQDVSGDPYGSMAPELAKELSKKVRKRLISKGGQVNYQLKNVPKMKTAFFKDIFTTAIDMPWR